MPVYLYQTTKQYTSSVSLIFGFSFIYECSVYQWPSSHRASTELSTKVKNEVQFQGPQPTSCSHVNLETYAQLSTKVKDNV